MRSVRDELTDLDGRDLRHTAVDAAQKKRLSDVARWLLPDKRSVADEIYVAETAKPSRGRFARSPAEISLRGWLDILSRSGQKFSRDSIVQVAGSVAFFGLLAIFPAIAGFVSLYGMFLDVATAREELHVLNGLIPSDALALVGDQMLRLAATPHSGLSVALLVSLFISIWSINIGMKALIAGLNIAFGEQEKRGFMELNLTSLGFTLGALIFLALAIGGVVVVPTVITYVGYSDGFLQSLRWPILVIIAIGAITVLYRFGPSREHERLGWVSRGSIIAAASWLLVSLLFSFYVAHFGSYDRVYGSLGAWSVL